MISRQARVMAEQLAAEGVALWLAVDAADGDPPAGGVPAFVAGAALSGAGVAAIRRACDALRPVYEAGEGQGGRVSVAVDPAGGLGAEELLGSVRELWALIGRENLMVRVPAGLAGLTVVRESLAAGISVDVAPVCSVEAYGEVLDAYFAGMERALLAGHCLRRIVCVTSVPVGLLGAEAEARLRPDGAVSGSALPGRAASDGRYTGRSAAVAVARLMYRLREQRLDDDWWRMLRSAGARPPRLLWTSVAARDVGAFVGSNTALALSVSELEVAAREAELAGDTLLNAHEEASRTLVGLREAGVLMREVGRVVQARSA